MGQATIERSPRGMLALTLLKFDVVFGASNVTVKTDIDVGQSQTVVVRVGIWA